MRIIFLGTPDFAVPALKAIQASNHEIIAVVTQPDKERGRGKEVTFSPVKEYAKKNGLNVLQYDRIRRDGVNDLKHLNPDLMVTAAYGQILSKELIDIPKHGIINIHASILPKYRGASPITWAVVNGEKETGVTLMRTEAGIDTGDVLLIEKTPIGDDETAGELFERLAEIGAEAILKGIDLIEKGDAVFTPQEHELATHCKMLTKEMGRIDFSKSAHEVKNQIRGMNPFPTAYFLLGEDRVKVFSSEVSEVDYVGQMGEVVSSDSKSGLTIKCGEGAIDILTLQYPNSKRVDAKAFLNGRSIPLGEIV